MNFTSRKPFRRTPNPVDDWLRNEGYFRKQTYNDATCLFRAVSEQIYMTQYYHFKVRRECVDFMKKNQNLFEKDVKIPFENYLKAMACATEWGGTREIRAMSLLYKREFVVYDGNKMTRNVVTNNGSDKFVNLCQTGHKKYESIFEREAISSAAFCQSIVYQTLYKGVFKIDGIDETVDKMLHDSSLNIRHDKFFLKGNVQSRDDLKVELINKLDNEEKKNADGNAIVESGGQDIPEIPYKVAKALDPNIYRNTELDVWHELTRGVRSAGWSRWNSSELQVGGKCYVMIEIGKENDAEKFEHKTKDSPAIEDKKEKNKDQKNSEESEKIEEITPIETKQMIGHIQEMGKNQGPVVVFIEELGKKMTVPFSSLTAIIPAKKTPWPTFNVVSVRKNYSYNSAYRWNSNNNSNNNNRKQWVSSNRRSKDTNRNYNGMDQLNNNEVNHNSNNMKKKENHENSSWNKKMNNPTSMMEKLTSIDNYSPKNSDKPIDVIEVRPVSVVFDNCQQNQESSSSLPTTGNPSPNDSSNGNNNSNSSSGNYTSGNNNSNDINTSGNGNSNSSNGISHSNSSGIPQNISTNSAQQNLTGSPNSNLTASTSMSVNCNSISTNNSQNDIYDTSKSAGNKSETEAANIVTPTARSTPVPLQSNEIQLQVFNPHQIIQGNSGPQMLGPNTGIVYITPDGNIYPPYNYYGGFIPESAPIAAPSLLQPPSFSQDQLNRLNLSAQFSYDANGSDLPLSDLNTLRYFYNIGIDCHYRNAGGICQSSPGQYAYGTPGLVPRGNYFQMIPAAEYQPVQIQPQVVPQSQQFQQQIQQPPPQVQQSQQQVQQPQQQVQQTQQQTQQPQQQTQQPQQQVQQQIQQPQQQQQPTPSAQNVSPSQNNSVQRQNNQQNRRRNDQNSHSGRVNNNYYGTQKNLYPRKNDAHEMNYHRDEGQHSVYDQQKSKNNCGNLDANSGGNREQKQNVAGNNNNNNNNGRYRKNNDTRNRVFERPGSYQQDYQRKQASNYQGNPYNNRHGNEGGGGQALHRGKIPEACTPTQTVNSSPSVAPLASASAGSAAPIASNVTQFYQNYPPPPPPPPPAQTSSYTFENYCQQNQNYYPVPAIVAPHDIHEGNNPVSAPTPYYCPALDNNYQPMFQPYVLPPPPAIYQNAPTTPGPEHWYPVPGNQQPPPPFMSPGFAPIPVPQPLAPPTTMKPPTSN